MESDTATLQLHHAVITVQTTSGVYVEACTCQLWGGEATFIDGRVDEMGNFDEDCPYK